jgi:PIN domain nuclease of toxin-antitoxin system
VGGGQVIVIDTHIWVWWIHGDSALPSSFRGLLEASEQTGIAVSAISCWEVAKLVELGRLALPCPVSEWLQQALSYPGIHLIELSPRICVESTQLPGPFHRDPADQIIVATARVLDVPLVTVDSKILAYPHVKLIPNQAEQADAGNRRSAGA